MAKDESTPSVDTGASVPTSPKPKGKGKWKITAVLFLVVLPLAAFALWVTIALTFSYAKGERAGFVQKLSNKGWVCKTWEGELALANGPNVMPEIFKFSVRDGGVAERINNSLGKQVKLTYEQHKGVPTQCFGETEYFVTNIEVVGAPPPAAGGTIAPAVTPTVIPPAAAPAGTPPTTTPAAVPAVTPPTTTPAAAPAVTTPPTTTVPAATQQKPTPPAPSKP